MMIKAKKELSQQLIRILDLTHTISLQYMRTTSADEK